MADEVKWRVSPQVFSDLYTIIAKHGMGIPDLDEDMKRELFGDRLIGPDAAAMEIREKYHLQHLPFGTNVKLIVDYKMDGYDKPEYEGDGS